MSHSPLAWFSVRHAPRPKKQLHNGYNLLCKVRSEAEETAELRAALRNMKLMLGLP